jgi:hypothetical protein
MAQARKSFAGEREPTKTSDRQGGLFMNAIMGNRKKALIVGVCFTALGVLAAGDGIAKLPEPDNIVYGLARDDTVSVSIRVQGVPIASFTMGQIPDAGDFYVLRVPMDALDPATPGTARPGDLGTLLVNGEPAAHITLEERGAIYRYDLQADGYDDDGLPFWFKQMIIDAAGPDDGIYEFADVHPEDDFEGDGETNWQEYLQGTDPTDPISARLGDIDGDKYITLLDAIVVLKMLSKIDPEVEVTTYGEVTGDGKIGIEAVLYIMQKISGNASIRADTREAGPQKYTSN